MLLFRSNDLAIFAFFSPFFCCLFSLSNHIEIFCEIDAAYKMNMTLSLQGKDPCQAPECARRAH